jgi:hypothetical protein
MVFNVSPIIQVLVILSLPGVIRRYMYSIAQSFIAIVIPTELTKAQCDSSRFHCVSN